MGDPVLHLLAGPNGAGKSTLHRHVIEPATGLPFVNADVPAAELISENRPPTAAESYEAARMAAERRDAYLERRTSFVAETVFSHESKVELAQRSVEAGYLVELHVVMVPEELSVARGADRVVAGGHPVPEDKIRERHRRLWPLVVAAMASVQRSTVYDNSRFRTPLRVVARFEHGRLVGEADWPAWTPEPLRALG